MSWIKFDIHDEKTWPPKNINYFLAYAGDRYDQKSVFKAFFAREHEIICGCYGEICDLDDECEDHYMPRGWYECCEHEEEGVNRLQVSHWRRLPPPPSDVEIE